MSICSVTRDNSRRGNRSVAIHQSSCGSHGQCDPRICPCNVCTPGLSMKGRGTLKPSFIWRWIFFFPVYVPPLKVLFPQTLRYILLCLSFTDTERSPQCGTDCQGHTIDNQSDREPGFLRSGLSICTAFWKTKFIPLLKKSMFKTGSYYPRSASLEHAMRLIASLFPLISVIPG